MTKKSVVISLISAIIVLVILIGVVSTSASTSSRTTRTLKEQTASDIKYNDEKINVYFFWGNGCQHCEALISYLNTLPEEYDNCYYYEYRSNKQSCMDRGSIYYLRKPDIFRKQS